MYIAESTHKCNINYVILEALTLCVCYYFKTEIRFKKMMRKKQYTVTGL